MPTRVIYWIMAGVFAWGLLHAIGAYRLNYNPWRLLIVLASTLLFLGFWATMLAARQARLERQREQQRQRGREP